MRKRILSGSAATPLQIERFHKTLPNIHFLSAYGLSEAAPISTLPYDDTLKNCIETVGKPMPHIKLEIRSVETDKKVDMGQQGEITVRGENLMTGYYRIKSKDQSIGEDGWLHTGDLGYLREDGYLCLSGRLKDLIIRGGENITPQEVASAVSTLECVDDVKVVGVESEFYGEEVCACIILKSEGSFDEDKAKKQLNGVIARFKIPSYFIIYDSFPMLSNGKVDMVSLKKDAAMKCEAIKRR